MIIIIFISFLYHLFFMGGYKTEIIAFLSKNVDFFFISDTIDIFYLVYSKMCINMITKVPMNYRYYAYELEVLFIYYFQHKCLPTLLACTQPCYSLNIFQVLINNSKTNSKFEKTFYLFVELVETNPLMYNINHLR